MGSDIYSAVEVRVGSQWRHVTDKIFPPTWSGGRDSCEPFDWRNYGMFGFFGNEGLNYSYVPAIAKTRRLPENLSEAARDRLEYMAYASWLSLDELLAFDYDRTFEDRRCTKDGNGAADAGEGSGKIVTFREFLGPLFFRDLEIMRKLDPDPKNIRIVFAFD